MSELLLINITGQDKPGLTSKITSILSGYKVPVLDIGQAVIHNHLSLGMLVEVPKESASSPVLKDLLFCAHTLGIQITFTPVTDTEYNDWVHEQGKPRHLLSLLARRITAEHLERVSSIIASHGLNIDTINRLSGRIPLEANRHTKACVEFSMRGTLENENRFREQMLAITDSLGIDIAFQEDNIFRRNRRLVVFDMDSTLITSEVIDELAIEAGVGAEVAAITEQAMRGEIDFTGSLQRRVSLLNGLDEHVLETIAKRLQLTEGAETLFHNLHNLGFKTAILSGGFSYFGHYLQKKLNIDYVYANTLEIIEGKLTGKVLGQVVDGKRKADLLELIAQKENIRLEQTIAVGDGANDLPMLGKAGLGIAFRAKPIVRESAKQAISTLGLDAILYLMGFRDRDDLSVTLPHTPQTAQTPRQAGA
ncbi:phosphoserine phosphatase SerB [Chlorobium sp. BLA1]|uniref:phosphoserine phosphatase SerB n=1 Tax=Candidatus Chlorobium masyuteum TaxID=2716876 RepID=UPI0014245CED|nr:phosphoserine phosphatase SerB [Candidatus Chlorobium masyuteum]NHQ59831.1 phosphoserine phosphatase SerB [Candidatus Chlorobium masyuteum]